MDALGFGWVFAAFGADAVEALGEAAFFGEGGGLSGNLAVEKRTGHTDEDESRVGGEFGVGGLGGLYGRCGRGFALSIRSILSIPSMNLPDPLRHGVSRSAAPGHQCSSARVLFFPQRQAAVAQEVLIIEKLFFEAGPGDVGQL